MVNTFKEVTEMWFRTKVDYIPIGKEIQKFLGIKKIKKGALVVLTNISPVGIPEFSILFPGPGGIIIALKRLDASDIELDAESCIGEGRNIFCSNLEEFFGVKGLTENIKFCPGCGQRLEGMPSLSLQEYESNPDRYYVFVSE